MGDYVEGQRLQGSDGRIYVVQGGVPRLEPQGGSAFGPTIGGNPTIPGQLQGQALNNTRTQQEIVNNPLNVASTQAGIVNTNDQIDTRRKTNIQSMRQEFNGLPQVKQYTEATQALGGMLRAPDSGQGDLAVIYAFAKLMDPGSVVREGEMQMANQTSSMIENLQRQYGRITEANRLPANVRQGLIEAARQRMAGMTATYGQTYQQYRDLAKQNGYDPEQVTGPFAGDAVRPLEEQYIKAHGGQPRHADGSLVDPNVRHNDALIGGASNIFTPVATDQNTRKVPYPEASAALDRLIRSNVSYEDANRQFQGNFPGAPPISRDEFARARQYAIDHPGYRGSLGNATRDVPMESPVGSFIDPNNFVGTTRNSFAQSVPGAFLTKGVNAFGGGLPGLAAGEAGRVTLDTMSQQHPTASFLGETGGAIAGTIGTGKLVGGGARLLERSPFLRPAATFLKDTPTRIPLLGDIVYGSTYGATQDPDHPLRGAVLGGGSALLGNQIGSRVIAPGFRAAAVPTRKLFGLPDAPAAISRGAEEFSAPLFGDEGQVAIGQMQAAADAGLPFSWADASARTRALGGNAVRFSPNAYGLAKKNLGTRTLGQVDRLGGIIEDELGPRLNLPTFKVGVKKSAQAQSKALYEKAKTQAPVGDDQINEMLQTPAGQRAARSGYDEAINNGEPVGDLTQEIDSFTGQPRLVGRPSWHVLQRMKFALDEMPDQTSLANRFNNRLGALNEDFRKANLTYSNEMKRGDIASAGFNAADPNIKAPELTSMLSAPRNMKDRGLFLQGYGANLLDRIGAARDTANPYNLASIASPDQVTKMEIVSPNLANRFTQARSLENEMSLTNTELFGGSPTQPRAQADKAFENGGMLGDVVEAGLALAPHTSPISLMRTKLFAGRSLFGGMKEGFDKARGMTPMQRADQMAPLLFNPDALANLTTLEDLFARKAARDAYVNRTGRIGSSIAAPIAIGYTANR